MASPCKRQAEGTFRVCTAAFPRGEGQRSTAVLAIATSLVGAAVASVTVGAVVVGAKVDSFAAKGAAVVDERLVLLDGHCDVMCFCWL